MNIADLERLLPKQDWPRTFFEGRTMASVGSRDEEHTTRFPSEDAMVRWAIVTWFKDEAPRPGAVVLTSAIAAAKTNALWRVTLPDRSELLAAGNAGNAGSAGSDDLLAIKDTTGLHEDPERGATQITILDAATGLVKATWLPPHGVTRAGFLAGEFAVSHANRATVVDPMTSATSSR